MPKFSLAGSIYFAINSFPQLNQLETPLKTSITNEIIINPKKIPTTIPVIRLNTFKTGASITFDKIALLRRHRAHNNPLPEQWQTRMAYKTTLTGAFYRKS